jgi:ubiquitin carboxyl-terminal hydrolase 22/27/51
LSSVTCSQCHTTSTTIDPILDVQLDFPTDASDMSALTLTDMLKRFCAAEKVGDATKGYDCSSCGGGAGVVGCIRLSSNRKLMIGCRKEARHQETGSRLVLPAQGESGVEVVTMGTANDQRFAHNATSTKVESPVRFPSQLNMQPYVEPPVAGQKALPPSLFEYDLFAVVTHEGKLDNGHYWADVLSGDEWWHCDDDKGVILWTTQALHLRS